MAVPHESPEKEYCSTSEAAQRLGLSLGTVQQMVENGQLDGWKTAGGDPVKNRDLWERLHAAARRHRVDWRWVKGHNGDPDNERVDAIARTAAQQVRDAGKVD